MTNEVSGWLEHELMPGFAVAGGYVYRSIENFQVLVNENRPMSAYNMPITIRDPGPDGVLGTADDGPGFPGFNLSAAALALPVRNILGQAYGRTFLAGATNGINYGSQRMLAEPIDSQRQDNVGLFFDVYNLTNADAAQNINWGSGSTYRFPVTIIGPTIMRFGAKLDW